MEPYCVPTRASETEFVEKRSRFIGRVKPVATEEEARAFLDEVRRRHHDARHNCWCYLLRDGPVRYSDDGEPQGTAGQPMLGVFTREGVTDLVCVVTRYFGGVLLGAGGLVRAYTRSAKDALDAAGISVVRPWSALTLTCGYHLLARLQLEAEQAGGLVSDTEYGAEVTLRLLLPEERAETFCARVVEVTAGTVCPQVTGTECRAVPRP